MDITLTFFTDFYNAVRNVIQDLSKIPNFPANEREKYRRVVDDTVNFIYNTLNLVMYRLGDIVLLQDDKKFLDEVKNLDNWREWANLEREFRLCNNLRATRREAQALSGRFGRQFIKDWDALLKQMDNFFQREDYVGHHIETQLSALASSAVNASRTPIDSQVVESLREQVIALKEVLRKDREAVMLQQHLLYEKI